MKHIHIALTLLLISCASLPSGTTSSPASVELPPAQVDKSKSRTSVVLPAEPQIDHAEARIRRLPAGDDLSLRVQIRKPLRVQNLELEKISHLRSWVRAGDLPQPIYNLNDFVAVNNNGENTSLRIQAVPRGRFRVVSVCGYQGPPSYDPVPAAMLKAVYDSPPTTTEVVLTFNWRTTATANIIEALLERNPAVTGSKTPAEIQELLENLDMPALEALLDRVIYGSNPVGGSTFALHPTRLNTEELARLLVETGRIPSLAAGENPPAAWLRSMGDVSLIVKTPNLNNFNSAISVQITDPASLPITIPAGGDTASLPQIVPGIWEAIVRLPGLNGGVSTRTSLTIDSSGQVHLTEGTSAQPIILPPVIKALSNNQGTSGMQLTLSGDGFDPKGSNIVKFGSIVATVTEATATRLVVTVPPGISGTVPVTVTNQGKQSNFANFEVEQKVVALSAPGGKPGESLTLTISGFDATTSSPEVVFSNGVAAAVTGTTPGTITVTIPEGAATGPITVTPQQGQALKSPVFTLNQPVITSLTPESGSPGTLVTVTGANFTGATAVTVNGVPVNQLTVVDDQTLTFKVPAGATTGPVQVTTPLGTATSATELTIPQAVVALSSPGGKPGQSVTITVSGFDPQISNPTVVFNGGVQATVTASTSSTLTVTVPAGATTGPITVTPQNGTPLQSPDYTIDTPLITQFTPTAGIGQQVVINGVNLSDATAIRFNGVAATSYTVNNDGRITVTVPAGSTDGPITVTTPLGTVTSTTDFKVLYPPTITNVAYDPLQPADPIVLTGNYYTPSSLVYIGTTLLNPTDYTVDSANQITITNPPLSVTLERVTVVNAVGSAVASLVYKEVINFIGSTAAGVRSDVDFQIDSPHGINVDFDSNIYIASLNHKVYKFTPAGANVYVSGDGVSGWRRNELSNPTAKFEETTLDNARFAGPEDLANDAEGNIYVADTNNHAIRKITPDGKVQVLARLPGPEGIEIDANGILYVTGNDPPNGNASFSYVMRIADLDTLPSAAELAAFDTSRTMTSNVTVIAGGPVMTTPAPATPVTPVSAARFLHLEGLGIDGQGNVYVADVDNFQIRKIDFQNNRVTVLANLGLNMTFPYNNDNWPYVQVHEIRVDSQGNVFVPAPAAFIYLHPQWQTVNKIYKIDPTGHISVIAGNNSTGLAEGKPLTEASFSSPRGVDFAPDGTLYIADTSWGIRRIDRYQPMQAQP